MARSWVLANVLWLAACGRLGFDTRESPADDATSVGPRALISATTVGTTTECGVTPTASPSRTAAISTS